MATITIKTPGTPDDANETFECDGDTTILDALEKAGLDHYYSCRTGYCSDCCMKILEGTLNREDQFFLSSDQLEAGFVLTCVAKPTSDVVVLLTEQEGFVQ